MLCRDLVRSVNTQPSKGCLKWILLDQACFDIRDLTLGAVCRRSMLTFWWRALISSPWRVTFLAFHRQICPKSSAWPYFPLNKIAPEQVEKGQGPPLKRTLIYDYVCKLKFWVIHACCYSSARTVITRGLWNLNVSRIALLLVQRFWSEIAIYNHSSLFLLQMLQSPRWDRHHTRGQWLITEPPTRQSFVARALFIQTVLSIFIKEYMLSWSAW